MNRSTQMKLTCIVLVPVVLALIAACDEAPGTGTNGAGGNGATGSGNGGRNVSVTSRAQAARLVTRRAT